MHSRSSTANLAMPSARCALLLVMTAPYLARCLSLAGGTGTGAAQHTAAPPQGASSQQQLQAAPFAAAAPCRALPTAATSTPDASGRLWGQRNGAACAFKEAAGRPLFYTGYEPASWLATAPCSMPAFSELSVMDSKLRVWAWESTGSLCAYKDDQQQPIPQQRTYFMQSWAEAPACSQQPTPSATTAAADSFGCLWGWQLDRSCAFRSAVGQPVYYKGYSGACDVAGNAQRAAQFNAGGGSSSSGRSQPGNQAPGLPTPPVVTGLGCIGQKNVRDCVEATVPVDLGAGAA